MENFSIKNNILSNPKGKNYIADVEEIVEKSVEPKKVEKAVKKKK